MGEKCMAICSLASIVRGMAFGAAVLCAPSNVSAASVLPGSREVAQIAPCPSNSRMSQIELTVDKAKARYHALCVYDRAGKFKTRDGSISLKFSPGAMASLRSVYSTAAKRDFEVFVSIDIPGQQTVTVQRRDGTECVFITATARQAYPAPKVFLPASADWRSSIGYMVDTNCQVLAAMLGNRVAVMPIGRAADFYLYQVHFVMTQH
jgi:hypothetical protein